MLPRSGNPYQRCAVEAVWHRLARRLSLTQTVRRVNGHDYMRDHACDHARDDRDVHVSSRDCDHDDAHGHRDDDHV